MNHEIEPHIQQADAELMPVTPQQIPDTLEDLKRQAEAMQAAMQVAEAMCSTELVPKAYRGKPADGAAAILYGAELGLGAIQSLQQVMVINGKPGVEARTMVALLRAKGFRFDTTEDTNEAVTVIGTSPTGESHTSRWTIEDAQTAGYTKNSLYKQIPRTMLYAKAATEVCRRLGSHILSGIAYSVEELQLHEQPVRATATRAQAPSGVAALKAARREPQPPREVEQAPEVVDEVEQQFLAAIAEATGPEGLGEIGEMVQGAHRDGQITTDAYHRIGAAGKSRKAELEATEDQS